jgi:DNA-directed RNA polymerase specialized sigma24 family protein
MGRPAAVVPSRHERELARRKEAHERAVARASALLEELDDAMARAYLDGVPILRIAKIVGTTRPTVYKALERRGVDLK